MTDPKIALISATPLAIAPAADAIRGAVPEGVIWNLLDDRLLADAQVEGGITASLEARMDALIQSALAGGADGVLLTCSQYGARATVRDRARDGVPVLSADGPLFDEVAALRPERVLLVASLESAAADSAERLGAALAEAGVPAGIRSIVVAEAARPTSPAELEELLGAALADATEPSDVVVLAQYSLAPAAEGLGRRLGLPVLDGPQAAARRLTSELATR